MPAISQAQQPRTGGTAYQETPFQVAAWKALRAYMREQGIAAGDTFAVKGTIAKMLLDGTDAAPRYFTKPLKDNNGNEKDWPFVKVLAAITDPRFGTPGTLDFPAKNVGASFFDGVTTQGRSPNRGGMYNLHVAVTGQEPSQALKDGKGDWDTEDYENKPILLRLEYQGKEEPDSIYADRRLGMKIFISGFEKDREVHRADAGLEDDDEDAAWSPATAPATASRAEVDRHIDKVVGEAFGAEAKRQAATTAADLSVLPATDRQVAFVYALGREAGMSKPEVQEWSAELFSNPPEQINRRDASSLIDALQRKRYDDDPKLAAHPGNVDPRPAADTGKDEVVSVGVSKKPAPPEDDEDLNFK